MNKKNMLTFLFGVAFIAAALCLACGCESEDDANCIKFENNSWNPAPKGCVPLDFDPDKADFTQPC